VTDPNDSLALAATFALVLQVFGVVGAVVAARLPGNPVGWLFLALALLDALYELGSGATQLALDGPDPGWAVWTGWLASWTNPLAPPFIAAALLLFPDGRPPTPRWRWALWLCGPLGALILGRYALAPGPLDAFPSVSNPLGIGGADALGDIPPEPFMYALIIAGAVALVVRFRRSHGVERQQVKWFAYAASLVAAFLLFGAVVGIFVGGGGAAPGFVFAACLCAVPISTGVAILRHRLYDLDVVVNRTLVYGALTVTLGATYLALVLLVGLAVGHSGFAVAVSTLAVAGLFRPARAGIQEIVDRRFYRRRYDAARTLEAFSVRLRDELDLAALSVELRGVVRETVQPAHVSLWLRSGP
jgi:hypothetical protein